MSDSAVVPINQLMADSELTDEQREAIAKVNTFGYHDRMKRALRRIVCGESIRGASEAEGYATMSDVRRAAIRTGVMSLRTDKIIEGHRINARLAGEELTRRLSDNPDEMKTAQLAVVGGIATDKILKAEERRQGEHQYVSALERLADRIASAGAELEINVSVRPTERTASAVYADEVIVNATPTDPKTSAIEPGSDADSPRNDDQSA